MDWETQSHASDCKLGEPKLDIDRISGDSKHYRRPQNADILQAGFSVGPEITEFNDENDAGYDADIEYVYPDGYEDASEPESSTKRSSKPHQDADEEEKATQHADLVYRLRRLDCERQSSTQPASHSRNDSGGSSGLKRSHSQESLTDTEEAAVPDHASPMSVSSHRHTRRRVTPSRSKNRGSTSLSPDHMDIDIEKPSTAE